MGLLLSPTAMTDEFYGTVKFYNNERGFGFIARDDNAGLGDLFVGRNGAGLHAGDRVSFDIEIGHDGRHRAINIKVVQAAGGGNGAARERERVWRHDGAV